MTYQEFDLSLSYGTECQLYIVSTQFYAVNNHLNLQTPASS